MKGPGARKGARPFCFGIDCRCKKGTQVALQEANILSLVCSDALKRRLTAYSKGLVEVLGDGLLGLYLYGSLARRCYHPATSDVDVVAVVRDDDWESKATEIVQVHQDLGVPVDAIFVTQDQAQADLFPTPIACLITPISGCKMFYKPEDSSDFLLQRQDVYEAGVVLVGAAPHELVRTVPWPLLEKCLSFLFPHIVPNFKNPALMLCRIAYAYTNHALCSKQDAGEWATSAFDERWSATITTELGDYAAGSKGTVLAVTLHEFEEYCAQYIREQDATL